MKLLNKAISQIFDKQIGLIFASALLIRIVLGFFGTLELDQNTFIAWGNNLAGNGFRGFYAGWCDYLPGYLYVLGLLGKIHLVFPQIPSVILFKIPAILADIATGFLIYKIVRGLKDEKWGLVAASFYVFNPAILANSTFWGQVDSLTALFSLLTVYFLTKNLYLSSVFLSLGVLVKPQAALVLLVVLFVFLKNKWKSKKLVIYGVISVVIFLLAFIPFYPSGIRESRGLLSFIVSRLGATLSQYPYTSVNAFSAWGLGGFWKADKGIIAPSILGGMAVVASTLVIGLRLYKEKKKIVGSEYFLMAFIFLAGFLFMARMHERHLLPSLAPLLITAVLIPDLLVPYFSLSVTYLVNLYYAFIWITKDFKEVVTDDVIKLLILVNLLGLFILAKRVLAKNIFSEGKLERFYLTIVKLFRKNEKWTKEKEIKFLTLNLSRRLSRLLLVLILLFSLFTRVYELDRPTKEYFDEVYHAFTARLVLHTDPKAWEWWNPHPEGFAYEWTHPPLAKLGMALGMKVMGENPLGWRLPGALLGVGCVFLIYLLSKQLFKDEALALIAAFVYSLDGLTLTMSRIGMNDTYLLFFTLLSILLFWKDKNFFSALAFGLAISSKWSAIYSIPIFLVSFLLLKKKLRAGLIWFLLIPPLVYIGSYWQMFLTGHAFDIFTGVQKQMWWYHTNLRATHPYTSPWWTWPFLIRPVYLFTSDEIGGWVSRIYNLGNPLVFWFGLISVAECVFLALVERNRKLLLITFSYLIFFAPWALSPRIMFFYHYLPSLPFLAITMGYLLRRNKTFILPVLSVGFILFLYFYPHWAGLSIPLWLDKSYYWFSSWR